MDWMVHSGAIAKREWRAYFNSPVAYVFIVIFLALAGFFTFSVGGFYEAGQADLRGFFFWHPWLYLILVPAVAMRLWAEERRQGTLEMLFTSATTPAQAIAGKMAAAWGFLALALALTFPVPLTAAWLGQPDSGVIFFPSFTSPANVERRSLRRRFIACVSTSNWAACAASKPAFETKLLRAMSARIRQASIPASMRSRMDRSSPGRGRISAKGGRRRGGRLVDGSSAPATAFVGAGFAAAVFDAGAWSGIRMIWVSCPSVPAPEARDFASLRSFSVSSRSCLSSFFAGHAPSASPSSSATGIHASDFMRPCLPPPCATVPCYPTPPRDATTIRYLTFIVTIVTMNVR